MQNKQKLSTAWLCN